MTTNAARLYDEGMPDEELSVAISLRITKEDRELLDQVAKGLPMKPMSIARVALRIGLAAIEKDPGALFRPIEDRKAMQSLAKDLLAKKSTKR